MRHILLSQTVLKIQQALDKDVYTKILHVFSFRIFFSLACTDSTIIHIRMHIYIKIFTR